MQPRLLVVVALLVVDAGPPVADARKSKLKPKGSKAKASARRTQNAGDWQTVLRTGDGRRAADALLTSIGISGGVAALQRQPTDTVVSRVAATSVDEWELYSLGAVLLREYSGDQACVKAGLDLLGRVIAQGGAAATPAAELSVGNKHKVMFNTMPCKDKGPSAPDCRPFHTLPLPPGPGETARARRAVGGWVGEALTGATVGETVVADGRNMGVTLLSQEPFIATVSNFLTPAEASQLVDTTTSAIKSRLPGGDLCVKPERTQSLARAREKARQDGKLNGRNWTCYPLSAGDAAELVTSTSVQVDRGVDDLVDEIDERILVAIGAETSVESRYKISSATQLLHYNATSTVVGAYGAHTDCHDFRGNTGGDDRSLTILIYTSTTNHAGASGATAFPVLGLEVSAVAGTAVVFQSLSQHGDCHPLSVHASLPMKTTNSTDPAVDKFVYQKWVHTGPYDRKQHGEGLPPGPAYAGCDTATDCRMFVRATREGD